MKVIKAVEMFLRDRESQGRAIQTMKDYHRALDPLVLWCQERKLKLNDLTRDAIRSYVIDLRTTVRPRGKPWKQGTVDIHMRNLRTFLGWLETEDLIKDNLRRAIAAPKERIKKEQLMNDEEVAQLLHACQGDDWSIRDEAAILMFLDTGMRLGEMVLLKREALHYDLNHDVFWMNVYGPKTDTYRCVVLGKESTAAVSRYLQTREGDGQPALWVGQRGPLTKRGMYDLVRRRVEAAGFTSERIHPHVFRKMFTTRWVDNGGPRDRLLQLCGWTSDAMLKFYLQDAELQELIDMHRHYGPVDRILKKKRNLN